MDRKDFFFVFRKSKFWTKIESFAKHRIIGQKFKLYSKIEIQIEMLFKNFNFTQKLKLYSKIEILAQKWKIYPQN